MIELASIAQDPTVTAALDELREAILRRYPNAAFETFHRDDPDGIRLRVTVDTDDTDEVLDIVIDRLYELQVEQLLPIYVIPVQPPSRTAAQLRTSAMPT